LYYLGIAGQLGNGELENTSTPCLVSYLSDKNVESLTCSQSQVFAVCSDGSVYTWGLSMDAVSYNAIEFSVLDKSAFVTTPSFIPSFTKKRRARQLSCGRRHYFLVTMGVYGPNCYLIAGSSSVSIDKALNYDAGAIVKLIVQACDELGEICTAGGSLVSGVLSSDSTMNPRMPMLRILAIDDDLDGKYSTRLKIEMAGIYELAITIDGVHIRGSPFEVRIQHLNPSLSLSCITFANNTSSSATCMVNESCSLSIQLYDEFMNKIQASDEFPCGIYCRFQNGSLASNEFSSYSENSSSCISLKFKVPGNYTIHAWVLDTSSELDSSLNLFVQDYAVITAEDCKISFPGEVISGTSFNVSLTINSNIFGSIDCNLFKISFQPLNHTLSPRALVRFGGEFDPLREVKYFMSKDENACSLSQTIEDLTISGDYFVKVTYGLNDIFSSPFQVKPTKPSSEFSEVINTHLFFSEWKPNTEKVFIVQVRDLYGNRVTATDDTIVEAFIKRIQGNTVIKTFEVSSDSNGTFQCKTFLDIVKQDDVEYLIHIKLNGEDIMYSPFSIDLGSHVSDTPIEISILSLVNEDSLKSAGAMDKSGITRRRALEALKKEQRKFEAEREEKRKKQSIRRTGGGFIVRFSSEI